MRINLPKSLPADPAAAYRLGYRSGRESTIRASASEGGKARAAGMTPERRREIAVAANRVRWGKPAENS